MLDRPRIGLHRDLDINGKWQPRGETGKQGRNRVRAKQGGCSTAEEHARDYPARRQAQIGVEIGQQGRDVSLLGNALGCRM